VLRHGDMSMSAMLDSAPADGQGEMIDLFARMRIICDDR